MPAATPIAFTSFLEGPAATLDGDLYVADVLANRIWHLGPDGELDVFREDSGRAIGNTWDLDGRLVTCEGAEHGAGGRRRLTRTTLSTGAVEVLVDRFEGRRLNSPNDVTCDACGAALLHRSAVRPADRPGARPRIRLPVRPRRDAPADRDPARGPPAQRDRGHPRRRAALRRRLRPRRRWPSPDLGVRPRPRRGGRSAGRSVYDFAPGRGGDGLALDVEGNLYVCAGIRRPRGAGETTDVPPGCLRDQPVGAAARRHRRAL